MRLVWLSIAVLWLPAVLVPARADAATPQHDEEDKVRRKRQALGQGGCADMSLFNYLLYYYLIQAQNAHQKHTQADQMASALLKLKQRRGTDPLPTLISTQAGQNALLAMLQNVAQNNPAQLLQLLTSIRDGGQQPLGPLGQLRQQLQPQLAPQPGWPAGYGSGPSGGGFRQQAPLPRFPPQPSANFGRLQANSALYRPQVQQALYPQQAQAPAAAAAASALRLPFGAGEDAKLDNSLQFSPSLRRQVYAPQPELEPTPPPPRTVIREPSTRLHVSTVTLVTTVLTSSASLVPLNYNGVQTSTEIMHTATHVLTATQLQTLAVVVTPTVVEANGQTTTLYGGDGAPSAEIVTDLNYQDDDARTSGPTPTAPGGIFSTSVVEQAAPSTVYLQAPGATALPPGATALPPGATLLQPGQTIIPSGQLLVQNGITTVVALAPPQQQPTPPPAPTTTTTKEPENRLLALLRSRAANRRRGVPLRGAARRRQQKERKLAEQQKQLEKQAQQQQQVHQEQHVSTSVSVSVSGEPPTLVDAAKQATNTSTPAPPPAPVFQPQQVPVYVEKDGVLVVAAGPLVPAGPVFKPAAASPTSASPVVVTQTQTAAATPPQPVTAPPEVRVVVQSAPAPPAASPVTVAAPVFLAQQQTSASPSSTTQKTPAPTPATTPATVATTSAPKTTTAKPKVEFDFDFEETVYASPSSPSSSSSTSTSSSSSSETTEKVVTEEDFQNLLDGTFVILAKSVPEAAAAAAAANKSPTPSEGSGAGPPSDSDSDVKVSVSYAVSTSVSEGR